MWKKCCYYCCCCCCQCNQEWRQHLLLECFNFFSLLVQNFLCSLLQSKCKCFKNLIKNKKIFLLTLFFPYFVRQKWQESARQKMHQSRNFRLYEETTTFNALSILFLMELQFWFGSKKLITSLGEKTILTFSLLLLMSMLLLVVVVSGQSMFLFSAIKWHNEKFDH